MFLNIAVAKMFKMPARLPNNMTACLHQRRSAVVHVVHKLDSVLKLVDAKNCALTKIILSQVNKVQIYITFWFQIYGDLNIAKEGIRWKIACNCGNYVIQLIILQNNLFPFSPLGIRKQNKYPPLLFKFSQFFTCLP